MSVIVLLYLWEQSGAMADFKGKKKLLSLQES